MRRSRWLLMAAFVLVSSMLMWACGGADEDTGPASETPEIGGSPGRGEDTGQFRELAGRFRDAAFKATYKISGSATREGVDGTIVWYKKGDNLRTDIIGTFQGQRMSTILITLPDQSYVCTQMPETGEGGSCFAKPAEAGQGADQIIVGLEEVLADQDVEIVGTASREIMGEGATCFTMRSAAAAGESEVCLSSEGVPLLSKATLARGDILLEAVDFSRDVSDGDFEPPYPLSEDAPDLLGQGQ